MVMMPSSVPTIWTISWSAMTPMPLTHTNIIRMEKDRFTNTIGLGYDKITDGQKESEKLKKKET